MKHHGEDVFAVDGSKDFSFRDTHVRFIDVRLKNDLLIGITLFFY